MKKLLILFLVVLSVSACYWQGTTFWPKSVDSATGSITIVLSVEGWWWSVETYMEGDLVWFGDWYISLQNFNLNHRPIMSPDWWEVFIGDE